MKLEAKLRALNCCPCVDRGTSKNKRLLTNYKPEWQAVRSSIGSKGKMRQQFNLHFSHTGCFLYRRKSTVDVTALTFAIQQLCRPLLGEKPGLTLILLMWRIGWAPNSIPIYIQQDATLHSLFISGNWSYMFRVVLPPIIRSAYNCVHSIWYLSHRYCYLSLSWKSWNWFECAVGGVRWGGGEDRRSNPGEGEVFRIRPD
jgi:hypothetical protein